MLSDTYTPIRSNPDSIVSTPLWPTSLTSQILQASGWIKLSLDGMKQCSHARQDTGYKQSRITLNITHMWEYTPHSVWLNKISSSYQNNSNIQIEKDWKKRKKNVTKIVSQFYKQILDKDKKYFLVSMTCISLMFIFSSLLCPHKYKKTHMVTHGVRTILLFCTSQHGEQQKGTNCLNPEKLHPFIFILQKTNVQKHHVQSKI